MNKVIIIIYYYYKTSTLVTSQTISLLQVAYQYSYKIKIK